MPRHRLQVAARIRWASLQVDSPGGVKARMKGPPGRKAVAESPAWRGKPAVDMEKWAGVSR